MRSGTGASAVPRASRAVSVWVAPLPVGEPVLPFCRVQGWTWASTFGASARQPAREEAKGSPLGLLNQGNVRLAIGAVLCPCNSERGAEWVSQVLGSRWVSRLSSYGAPRAEEPGRAGSQQPGGRCWWPWGLRMAAEPGLQSPDPSLSIPPPTEALCRWGGRQVLDKRR